MIFPDLTGVGTRWSCLHKLLAPTLASLLAITATAADNPRPPEERFANEIRNARQNIEGRQGELKWLVNDLESLGDFGKADPALMRQDFANSAAAWQTVAETFRRSDAERAKQLQREADALQPTTLWRTRIETRHRQAELWPADDWVLQLMARGAR